MGMSAECICRSGYELGSVWNRWSLGRRFDSEIYHCTHAGSRNFFNGYRRSDYGFNPCKWCSRLAYVDGALPGKYLFCLSDTGGNYHDTGRCRESPFSGSSAGDTAGSRIDFNCSGTIFQYKV